jgi:F-type H+-transporting ATPase subunit b
MLAVAHSPALVLAAAKESSGNFLVQPGLGLMIWTLLAFGITLYLLKRFAFPKIGEALDRRQQVIAESIDAAERTRQEAEQILQDYRERLREARLQAEEIVERARKAAEAHEREAVDAGKAKREELLEQTRKEIQIETQRAILEIRKEVADLTVLATEKVTRKALTPEDQQRLVAEALSDLDFSKLAGNGRN